MAPFWFAMILTLMTISDVNTQGIRTPNGCRVDVCFIMDTSGSITTPNWVISTEFVANFTSLLTISPEATQGGVISFNSGTYFDIALNKHSTKEPLMANMLSIPYRAGGTSIDLGLQAARLECFNENNGDRSDAPNIAVLMTDGQSDPISAINEANLLRSTGATIIAIGIGSGIDADVLLAIAADEENVFYIDDFESLYEDIHQIIGKSCEPSQNCAGGQLGKWNGSYPMLLDCPELRNPVIEDNQFIKFYCGLNYSIPDYSNAESRFVVTFLFDGDEFADVPPRTVGAPVDQVALHEKYLYGKLGKYISCRVQTYYTSTSALRSPTIVSRSYWAGISYSHDFLDVYENDESPRTMFVYSTLPVTCSDSSQTSCELPLDIISEKSIAVFQNQDGLIRKCTYIFYSYDWTEAESIAVGDPLQIVAQKDPFVGVFRRTTVAVRARNLGTKYDPNLTQEDRTYPNPWNGYEPGNITVLVYDSLDQPATCKSTGDPRVTTFDGSTYSAQQIGCFTYVESYSSRDFQVHVQHYGCWEGATSCAVACGVAVKEGTNLNILSVCQDDTLHVIDCTGSSHNRVTTSLSNYRYMITTPGGARVTVYLLRRGMNVYITVPGRDKRKTAGLCGTYDDSTTNDFLSSERNVEQDPNIFINSWRNPFPCLFGCNITEVVPTSSPTSELPTAEPVSAPQNPNNLCNCADHGDIGDDLVNASQCGLPVLEDPLSDIANPDEVIEALIPGFLKENAGPSRSLYSIWSYVSSIFDQRTDNVDDEYRPVYIPESYLGDENPPAWGTFNITEQEARDHCTQHIQQSDVYATCSSVVSQTSFEIIVQKGVSDIQRTGNLDWANDKVYEYQDRCMQLIYSQNYISDRDDPMSDPSFGPQLELFLDTSCTEDCSGHGSCFGGVCQCHQGFVGGSCAIPEGTPPTVSHYLGPDICDVRDRLCQTVRLQATNVIKSENLTCRVEVRQLNGHAKVFQYEGRLHTGTTVQCPLPDLLTLDIEDSIRPPSAVYSYSVEISNDGVKFESTDAGGPRYVVDTLCMDCINNSSCNQKEDTCMVDGHCHAAGDIVDACYGCFPESSLYQLTVNPNLPKPEIVSGFLYTKIETEDLVLDLEVSDSLGKPVIFSSQIHSAPNIELLHNGTLLWFSTPEIVPPVNMDIKVTVLEGCPRQNTVIINLMTVACEDVCGPGGLCTPDPGMPLGQGHYICQCGSGFWGPNCEHNVNECVSNPCVHGQCVDDADGYTCDCLDGYGGTHCDLPTGTLGEWSEFGPCTKDCDYGMMTRTRICLAAPCTADSTEQNVLCDELNCDELDVEQSEGSVLVFKDADMLLIVEEEANILDIALDVLNIHCNDNPVDCCSAVGLNNENQPTVASPFELRNVKIAQGFPNMKNNPYDIRLKVIVEVTQDNFKHFCQVSAARQMRDLSGAQVMVEKDFIDNAMSKNSMMFVQQVGVEVGVEGVDEVEEGDNAWLIALICVSGVLLIVVITLTALLVKHRRFNSEKQRILQKELAGSFQNRPIDHGLTQHIPSMLTPIARGQGALPLCYR